MAISLFLLLISRQISKIMIKLLDRGKVRFLSIKCRQLDRYSGSYSIHFLNCFFDYCDLVDTKYCIQIITNNSFKKAKILFGQPYYYLCNF